MSGRRVTATLVGQYEHALEARNRLFIPARFREHLAARRAVLTLGLDGCLFLYPETAWGTLTARLRQQADSTPDMRAFVRVFFSHAFPVELDRQGRILIPQTLLGLAGIRREAVIIGVNDRVEIWGRERWAAYRRRAQGTYMTTAKRLAVNI